MASENGDVVGRYSALARVAMAGGHPVDCGAEEFEAGCFGAAAYGGAEASEGALRASLGCGNPVAVAELAAGETVLDLGSGGGLDVLLSARRVGPSGWVYGLDASLDMLELARGHAAAEGVGNVEFRQGRIEEIPLPDAAVDVVISNCVVNLSGDKPAVLGEAFRVLRPGGRFGISDVVAEPGLEPAARAEAESQVGCVATLTAAEYRELLQLVGFADVAITPTTEAGGGLHSAIVRARKPGR